MLETTLVDMYQKESKVQSEQSVVRNNTEPILTRRWRFLCRAELDYVINSSEFTSISDDDNEHDDNRMIMTKNSLMDQYGTQYNCLLESRDHG